MKPPLRVPRPRRLSRPVRARLPHVRSVGAGGARSASSRLLVVGDLVLDIVVAAEAPLIRGSDTPGTIRFRLGGSAANAAREYAALGGEAIFVGSVGADRTGRELNGALRRAGVTPRTVVHPRLPTARLVVSLTADGERTFITERGAADLLEPDDLEAGWFRGVRAVHVPLYSLLSEPLGSASRRAMELGRAAAGGAGLVSVDLASVGPLRAFGLRPAARLIASVAPDVLFANTAEAALFGARSWPARLLELAPIVVVKQGPAGCEVLRRAADADAARGGPPRRFTVATRPVAATDTTGAGDAFDAGFLRAVLSAGVAPADLTAAQLRSAAVAGNRAAEKLLVSPRADLGW